MKRFRFGVVYGLVLASAAVLVGNPSAKADVAVTIAPGSGGFNNNPWSLGYEFTVNSAINVTHLGFFDYEENGFGTSHDVGIYTSTGTLLASTTVTSADPIENLFRYHALSSSLALAAGQNYVIVGTTGADDYVWDQPTFSTAPEITFVKNMYILSSVLAFPDTTDPSISNGYFGPNFKFENAGPVVPEPSALISGAIAGLIGLGVARRRRRSA